MVGLVLVSHSRALSEGVAELVLQMAGEVEIKAAGGDPEGRLGTNPGLILQTIEEMKSDEILVFMDLGSAVLSTEAVLEMLDEDLRERVHLVDAPFVEGAFAAGVLASAESEASECIEAAEEARTTSKLH